MIYIEGGGDGKDQRTRCQEGFNELLQSMDFGRRMPRLVACGGRQQTLDRFQTAMANGKADFIGLWVDSEEAVDLDESSTDDEWDALDVWRFLGDRDGWQKPAGAVNEQVLLMVACMESWIVADRGALAAHFNPAPSESNLPPLHRLERRDRHSVQGALVKATAACSNAYAKGGRSFLLLEKLNPETLRQHLGSFRRAERILDNHLAR